MRKYEKTKKRTRRDEMGGLKKETRSNERKENKKGTKRQ